MDKVICEITDHDWVEVVRSQDSQGATIIHYRCSRCEKRSLRVDRANKQGSLVRWTK